MADLDEGAIVLDLVLRSAGRSRVFKTVSDSDGVYVIERIEPGKYVVMLTKMQDNTPLLPERYSSTITSPLVAEIARGDTLDFIACDFGISLQCLKESNPDIVNNKRLSIGDEVTINLACPPWEGPTIP